MHKLLHPWFALLQCGIIMFLDCQKAPTFENVILRNWWWIHFKQMTSFSTLVKVNANSPRSSLAAWVRSREAMVPIPKRPSSHFQWAIIRHTMRISKADLGRWTLVRTRRSEKNRDFWIKSIKRTSPVEKTSFPINIINIANYNRPIGLYLKSSRVTSDARLRKPGVMPGSGHNSFHGELESWLLPRFAWRILLRIVIRKLKARNAVLREVLAGQVFQSPVRANNMSTAHSFVWGNIELL